MDKNLHQAYSNTISYSICLYQNVFFLLIVLQYSSASANFNLNIVCILVLNLIGSSSNVCRVVGSECPGEDGAAVLGHHVSPGSPIIMAIKPGALRSSHIGVAPSAVHCHAPKHVELSISGDRVCHQGCSISVLPIGDGHNGPRL